MKLNGAQILIEVLCKQGVTDVFGYPGGAVLPIYDALYDNSYRLNHILSAHEQGAAHAADGYARVKNTTGVVISTSGPGATNLVTGIANAYLDSVPLVAITGNVAVPLLGRDSFQEVDIVGITQPVVKHNFVVRDVNELEFILNEAFEIANSGRKGPVLVDIPKSIQTDSCEYFGDTEVEPNQNTPEFDCAAALGIIKKCKRPFIYAGGGVIAANAESELLELSKILSAPVGLSLMGLTALPASYELNLGMSGMHGRYAPNIAQSECDLLIALGVRFSDRATGNTDEYSKEHTIIHIDIDLAEMGKNVDSHICLCGNAKAILSELIAGLSDYQTQNPEKSDWDKNPWLARISEIKKVDIAHQAGEFSPQKIIAAVCEHYSPDTVVATDVGQHQMWTAQYYNFEKPRTLLTSGGLGTMGYGMGAAIGGCIAGERKPTVLFTSDGSFGMNLNEMATAVSQRLPITIILLNNGVLGMVRQWQTMFYDKHYSHTTLERKTDFVKLAEAFGGRGILAENMDELKNALNNTLPDGPTLIDCRIDMDEKVFPMIPPGGAVKNIVIRS